MRDKKANRLLRFVLMLLLLAMSGNGHAWGAAGPYIQPMWTDFAGPSLSTSDYIVATYYFYWYDVRTRAHIINSNGSDALTTHPDYSTPAPLPPQGYAARPPAAYSSPPDFSFQDPDWHAREVPRIAGANIDVMLPVYWGIPGVEDWSNAGLRTLDTAMSALENAGQPVPAVGLFYDTTTLRYPIPVDLSTPAGKEQFYGTIRDFYSLVPPQRWARLDGRALVWLYSSAWPTRIDPAALTQAADRFAGEFGGVRLFFVGDIGWRRAGAPIDLIYAWGAAVRGPIFNDVAELGPGYNDSAVIDRPRPIITDRQNGAYYYNGWQAVHGSGRRLVALETWNEYHEGSDISPSYEYGWQYWTITAREATRHHFPAAYVRQAYAYLLGRVVDPSGFATFTSLIDRTGSPAAVRDALVDSPEARARISNEQYVTFLYNRYLGRDPDPTGYASTLARLAAGTPRPQVRDDILNSTEARLAVPDAQFVTEAYRQILQREPDPTGFSDYMQQLRSGAARGVVRDRFINSIELRYRNLDTLGSPEQAALFDFTGRPCSDCQAPDLGAVLSQIFRIAPLF